MTFNQEWDQRYSESTHMSVWPWSDLVSLVYRYGKEAIAQRGRVLELGCGAGANIPLFLSLQMQYHALEGSPAIVNQLHQRFPELRETIRCADFTAEQPFDGAFDFVIDRGSLDPQQHRSHPKRPGFGLAGPEAGGLFFRWTGSPRITATTPKASQPMTHTPEHFYTSGQFTDVGRVHFSDADHLRDIFQQFDVKLLEEKIQRRFIPEGNHQFAGLDHRRSEEVSV